MNRDVDITVTLEGDTIAVWLPGEPYPVLELDEHEAQLLRAALGEALMDVRWVR